MRRSAIENAIRVAGEVCSHLGFALPPFARWTRADWMAKGPEWDEVRDCSRHPFPLLRIPAREHLMSGADDDSQQT